MASLLLSSNGKSEENLDLPDRTVEEKAKYGRNVWDSRKK